MTLNELQNLIYKIPNNLHHYEVRFKSPYWENTIVADIKADFVKQQILFTGAVVNSESASDLIDE